MKKISWKALLGLQAVVMIYSISSVCGKMASGYDFLSIPFLMFFGAEFGLLGIYAIFWQQILKRFDLSVAYANRAMTLVWSMIWAVILFGDRISVGNIAGIVLIMVGIFLVNTEKEEAKE